MSEPPVPPGCVAAGAPLTNFALKSGVPFVPSHKSHPDGMLAINPCHMQITPEGIPSMYEGSLEGSRLLNYDATPLYPQTFEQAIVKAKPKLKALSKEQQSPIF